MRKVFFLFPVLLLSCIQTYTYKIDERTNKVNSILIGRFAPGLFKPNFFLRKVVLTSVDGRTNVVSTFRVKESEFEDFHLFVVENIPPGKYYISLAETEQRDVHVSRSEYDVKMPGTGVEWHITRSMRSWNDSSISFNGIPREENLKIAIDVGPGSLVWAGEVRFTSDMESIKGFDPNKKNSILFYAMNDKVCFCAYNGKHESHINKNEALLFEQRTLNRVRSLLNYYSDWNKVIGKRLEAIKGQL